MKRLLLLPLLVLTGCGARGPGTERDLAGEVREAAASRDSVVEVRPLSDPAAEALLRQAHWFEEQGRLEEAIGRVREALEISPRDPAYWQYLAELELGRAEYDKAIRHARHSYALGPQVGELCSRNWLTIGHAFEALKRSEASVAARDRAEECTLERARRF